MLCYMQEHTLDYDISGHSPAIKAAKIKVKKLTVEQLAARRRRLWMMIAKKEIPRVFFQIVVWVGNK